MRIRHTGKCVVCGEQTVRHRDFGQQGTIFGDNVITQETAAAIIAWRDKPIVCDNDLAIVPEEIVE